jgi:hypothetical protein
MAKHGGLIYGMDANFNFFIMKGLVSDSFQIEQQTLSLSWHFGLKLSTFQQRGLPFFIDHESKPQIT